MPFPSSALFLLLTSLTGTTTAAALLPRADTTTCTPIPKDPLSIFAYTGIIPQLSIQNLFSNGTNYLRKQQQQQSSSSGNFSCQENFAVWSIYASTSASSTASKTQRDFTQMQILYIPKNDTKVVSIDNFGGPSSDSYSNASASAAGVWGDLDSYELVGDEIADSRTWASYNPTWLEGLDKSMKALAAKKLNGPWDELTISLPKYVPGSNTTLNNDTLWYEFSGNGNFSVSYIVSENGRVFKRG